MKDKEIIHALSCCSTRNCKFGGCLFDDGNSDDVENCTTEMAKAALDLINRQQEEIVRLTVNMNAFGRGMQIEAEKVETAKAEAIKEFAERLKGAKQYSIERHENIVPTAVIDWIVKEMVGDAE